VLKIVVCDEVDNAFQNSGELSRLEALGNVSCYSQIASHREELIKRLGGAFAIVAIRDRSVSDRQSLIALPDPRLIASTGPRCIDVRAATEMGIVVVGTFGTSTLFVAEHVFGMLLALARRIPESDQALRQKCWNSRAGMELRVTIGRSIMGKEIYRPFALGGYCSPS
jgi:D-3-phosphoglycerate dehydrogenase